MTKTEQGQPLPAASTVNAIGLFCPMPVVRLKLELESRKPGEIVELLADDPGVEDDVPAWCRETGHQLVSLQKNENGIFVACVRVKGGTES